MIAALTEECYGKVFNLGSPQNNSLLDLVTILHQLTGVEHVLVPFPADRKLIDIGDYYGDYSKFSGVTGWHPRVELNDGLKLTIDFFKSHSKEYWA